MGVFWNWGTAKPWVSILKQSNFGWFGGNSISEKTGIYTYYINIFFVSYVYGWESTHRHGFTHVERILPYLVEKKIYCAFLIAGVVAGMPRAFPAWRRICRRAMRKSLAFDSCPVHDAERMSSMQQKLAATIWMRAQSTNGTMWNHVEPGWWPRTPRTLLTFSAHLICLQYNTSDFVDRIGSASATPEATHELTWRLALQRRLGSSHRYWAVNVWFLVGHSDRFSSLVQLCSIWSLEPGRYRQIRVCFILADFSVESFWARSFWQFKFS